MKFSVEFAVFEDGFGRTIFLHIDLQVFENRYFFGRDNFRRNGSRAAFEESAVAIQIENIID